MLPIVHSRTERWITKFLLFLRKLWYFRSPLIIVGLSLVPIMLVLAYHPRLFAGFVPATAAVLFSAITLTRAYKALPWCSVRFEKSLAESVVQPEAGEAYRTRVRLLMKIQFARYKTKHDEISAAIEEIKNAAGDSSATADPKKAERKKRHKERAKGLTKQLNTLTTRYAKIRGDLQELLFKSRSLDGAQAIAIDEEAYEPLEDATDHITAAIEADDPPLLENGEQPPETPEVQVLPLEKPVDD